MDTKNELKSETQHQLASETEVLNNLEDDSCGLQLVTPMLTEHEERYDVTYDTEQHDRRCQPHFNDVSQ